VLRATKILQERAFSNDKIRFTWNALPESINGTEHVESLTVTDKDSGERNMIQVGGVFIFTGLTPNTGFASGVVKMDEAGYIHADHNMATSVPGSLPAGIQGINCSGRS